jgi:2-oxoglutarate dehydrogenase E2 component (dihydrolipoamide succinyltransferase)
MTKEIRVPQLGESVSEATVGTWYKKEGDFVKKDELIVELETDKINMEINAESDCVLDKIHVKQGSVVGINDVLCSVKEGASSAKSASISQSNIVSAPEIKIESSVSKKELLSPAVKRIVAENNVDIASVSGTGKDGRLTKGDVLSVPQGMSCSSRKEERVKMSRLRQRIAERLKDSQNTAAILTTFNEVDLSKVTDIRNKYKDMFVEKFGVKLGFMSFFVKAAISALKDIPAINAEIDGDEIIYKNYYDIGVAVGTDKGLVVPVIKGAEHMSFAQIEQEILNLAKKARDGKLSMSDLSGGTFSITNGGTYGSMLSTPILNPPQSGILGMHNIVKRPVVVGDQIVIRPIMYLALSYDHRIVDGKEAVTFLVKIKEYLENPELFGLLG